MPGKLRVSGMIASTSAGNVKVGDQRQWKMLLHEDFHKGTVENWEVRAPGKTTTAVPSDTCSTRPHTNSDYFLGSFDDGSFEAVKAFLLPPHQRLKVQARFHFIDKWEGQSVFVKVDGQIVWIQRHNWCSKLLITMCEPKADAGDDGMTINACGDASFPDRLSVPVEVTLAHTEEALEISFGSNLPVATDNVGPSNASWGVDDLQISIV